MERRFKEAIVGQVEDMCELRLELDHTEDQDAFPLRATVYMTEADVDLRNYVFKVGVTRADLTVQFEGCETVMGSTYGQRPLGELAIKESQSIEKSKGIGLNAEGSQQVRDVKLGAQGDVSYRNTNSIQKTKETVAGAVRYRTNGRWRIEVPSLDGRALVIDGVAIDNATLARIRPTEGANRLEVTAEVTANKRDLQVQCISSVPFVAKAMSTRNRDAVLEAVVRKSINRGLGNEADLAGPRLVLARSGVVEK